MAMSQPSLLRKPSKRGGVCKKRLFAVDRPFIGSKPTIEFLAVRGTQELKRIPLVSFLRIRTEAGAPLNLKDDEAFPSL